MIEIKNPCEECLEKEIGEDSDECVFINDEDDIFSKCLDYERHQAQVSALLEVVGDLRDRAEALRTETECNYEKQCMLYRIADEYEKTLSSNKFFTKEERDV